MWTCWHLRYSIHKSISRPFCRSFKESIKYRITWFNKLLNISISSFSYKYNILKIPDKTIYTYLPKPLLEIVDHTISSSPSQLALYNSLTDSDCHFFIQYIFEDTLRLRWFLVQINPAEIKLLNVDSKNTDDCRITSISQYLDDSHLCYDTTRWYHLWYEYNLDDKNISVGGAWIIFDLKDKPGLKNISFGANPFI